jgi:hypothetical protein
VVFGVGPQAAALPEKLVAAVAKRAADHSGAGDERRLEAFGARQRQRLVPLDLALADHRSPVSIPARPPAPQPGLPVHLAARDGAEV